MRKTILKYGLISGLLCAAMLAAVTPLENRPGFEHGYLTGYTLIVLSFLLVFFGIRSYRDQEGGRADHLRTGVRSRHLHHADHLRLLCGYVGDYLLQLHARLYG